MYQFNKRYVAWGQQTEELNYVYALPIVNRRFSAMFKVILLLYIVAHLLEGGPFSELTLRNIEVLCT